MARSNLEGTSGSPLRQDFGITYFGAWFWQPMAGHQTHQTPSFRFDHRDVHEPRSNCSKQWKINLATDRGGSSVFGGGGGCGDGSGSSCRSLVRY